MAGLDPAIQPFPAPSPGWPAGGPAMREGRNHHSFRTHHVLAFAGEGGDHPDPAPDALVEALEIVFLVGRVDGVVVERKADHQAVHPEHLLEIADDRDRAARAEQHWSFSPFSL